MNMNLIKIASRVANVDPRPAASKVEDKISEAVQKLKAGSTSETFGKFDYVATLEQAGGKLQAVLTFSGGNDRVVVYSADLTAFNPAEAAKATDEIVRSYVGTMWDF